MLICPCTILRVIYLALVAIGIASLALIIVVLTLRQIIRRSKAKRLAQSSQLCVGIFHPYCNAGGGGERVLWAAIRAMQNK